FPARRSPLLSLYTFSDQDCDLRLAHRTSHDLPHPGGAAMRSPRSLAAAVAVLFGLAGPLWSQGYLITDLGTLGGTTAEANAINNSGQITGSASTASDLHAFLWQSGNFTDINLPESNGLAISSNGFVAGYFFPDYGSASHAF